MKGIITVSEIDKRKSVYVSEADYDETYASENNIKGWFQVVIFPIENELRYYRANDGRYRVHGEAWICTGGTKAIREKSINELLRTQAEKKRYIYIRQHIRIII